MVQLENDEGQQILNVLATTKDHPWIVTNPLIQKIAQQLQKQGHGSVTQVAARPNGDSPPLSAG